MDGNPVVSNEIAELPDLAVYRTFPIVPKRIKTRINIISFI